MRADEGMWTFDNPPIKKIKEKYNFTPDDKWLEHLRLSTVKFGGASGAFVSQDGLVLTNHHVGLRYIEKISEPGEKDYAKKGFVAKAQADEIKIPDLKLYTLMKSINVTEKVNAVVKPGMDDKQATEARLAKLTKLRDDLDQRDGLRADWVILYRGGEYWINAYKVHRDVRLVMAPEAQIAFYGGDAENWTYPRHDVDFALFRVYEGGTPYHPAHFLKWSREGIKAGDLTFVAGSPGSTNRLDTVAQMKYWRDVKLPSWIADDEAHREALIEFGKSSETRARMVSTDLFFTENNLKAAKGELAGLLDTQAFSELEKLEKELRSAVAKDPKLQAESGLSWVRIEEILEKEKPLVQVASMVNSRNSKLLKTALAVVRCAQELDKPPAERLEDYRTRDDADYEQWRLGQTISFEDMELETFLIAKGLEDIQKQLDPQHPFRRAVLGDKTPFELAKEAVTGTKMQMQYIRRDLIQGRSKAIAKSLDPLVVLARAIETFSREIDQQRESNLAITRDHTGRIARARFALFGNSFYPDATGTLRFSYGAVEGYIEEGKPVEPFTTFGGLYDKALQKGPIASNGAWALPVRWQERKNLLDLGLQLNFCHKVDIIGGNSGSPTINTKGEFVGVVFDSNLQSLPGKFYYDEKVNRAVSLDSRAIIEVLVKVYDAKHLADEVLPK
jgi:hypothetical protein